MRLVKKLLESCELNASQTHKMLCIIQFLPATVERETRMENIEKKERNTENKVKMSL